MCVQWWLHKAFEVVIAAKLQLLLIAARAASNWAQTYILDSCCYDMIVWWRSQPMEKRRICWLLLSCHIQHNIVVFFRSLYIYIYVYSNSTFNKSVITIRWILYVHPLTVGWEVQLLGRWLCGKRMSSIMRLMDMTIVNYHHIEWCNIRWTKFVCVVRVFSFVVCNFWS